MKSPGRHITNLATQDLKVEKLSHADVGQMQLYVNFYDEAVRTAGDDPTLGLILCVDKNDLMVRYTLGKENRQIFASRYKLHLPSKEGTGRGDPSGVERSRRRRDWSRNLSVKFRVFWHFFFNAIWHSTCTHSVGRRYQFVGTQSGGKAPSQPCRANVR